MKTKVIAVLMAVVICGALVAAYFVGILPGVGKRGVIEVENKMFSNTKWMAPWWRTARGVVEDEVLCWQRAAAVMQHIEIGRQKSSIYIEEIDAKLRSSKLATEVGLCLKSLGYTRVEGSSQ